MKPLCVSLIFSLSCALAGAGEPFLEKIDLFEGGKDGFSLYRIPGIVVTNKGTALAYCEARKTSGSDWGEIEVHLRRSTDGGKTWDAAKQIAHHGDRIEGLPTLQEGGDKQQTVNNPVAIVDRVNGAVHFLYCINYQRCFYMRSEDDGVTFSNPVEITAAFEKFREKYAWTVLATGPGHGIQLISGRLLVPVWLAAGKNGAHAPSVTAVVYSDDFGKTWHAGDIALEDTAKVNDPNETAAVQLSDGRVMLNARTKAQANRRVTTVSVDGATGWSPPRFDQALWDPICMGSIVRLSLMPDADKNRILFSNPHSLKLDEAGQPVPGAGGPRQNLSIKMSLDEAKTWAYDKVLEPGSSAYSDLAVLPDSTVLCFYERGKLLTVARFNAEWVSDGKETVTRIGLTDFGGKRESFQVLGREGFVIPPVKPAANGSKPWVWYAPTIGKHPGEPNAWLLTKLRENGFWVAGFYHGETFANPIARRGFDAFYQHVTKTYGLNPKVCLVAQSRGGLNHYNFAADYPDRVQCIAGIYTVGDLRSFPKLPRAAAAYSLTEAQLEAQLAQHNPIDRLEPIAKTKIPILHVHGDADKIVPIEQNSQVIHDRYKALGGEMELIVVPGKGHESDPRFFESEPMLNFLLKHGLGQ